jgi:hypothetical protein
MHLYFKKRDKIMSKKILMLVGDYAEDYETIVPFQFLTGQYGRRSFYLGKQHALYNLNLLRTEMEL